MMKSKGQSIIETTVALVALFIFLFGVARVFVWVNRSMVERQEAYQATRVVGGKIGAVDFYTPDRFYIFSAEEP